MVAGAERSSDDADVGTLPVVSSVKRALEDSEVEMMPVDAGSAALPVSATPPMARPVLHAKPVLKPELYAPASLKAADAAVPDA